LAESATMRLLAAFADPAHVAERLDELEIWTRTRDRDQLILGRRWLKEQGITAQREQTAFRHYLLGRPQSTIAALMGVKVSTVKEWLKRSRTKLRQRFVPLDRSHKYENGIRVELAA
jgi:hypothetical protein